MDSVLNTGRYTGIPAGISKILKERDGMVFFLTFLVFGRNGLIYQSRGDISTGIPFSNTDWY